MQTTFCPVSHMEIVLLIGCLRSHWSVHKQSNKNFTRLTITTIKKWLKNKPQQKQISERIICVRAPGRHTDVNSEMATEESRLLKKSIDYLSNAALTVNPKSMECVVVVPATTYTSNDCEDVDQ